MPTLLSNLPGEIQSLILHHVFLASSPSQLKKYRYTSRNFHELITAHLFHTLHLSASTSSFARLQRVAATESLARHVRELVYHRGTFYGHCLHQRRGVRPFEDYQDYVTRHDRTTNATIERYNAFAREVASEDEFNQQMTWRMDARKSCSSFPNLHKLTLLCDIDDVDSEYLRRSTGLTYQIWTANYFAPYEIFEAAGPRFTPKALSFDSVNGEDFNAMISSIRGGATKVAERFKSLHYLRVSFSETVSTLNPHGAWDILLQSCTNLEALSLGMRSFFSNRHNRHSDSFPRLLTAILSVTPLPRIVRLELDAPAMSEQEFLAILTINARSLRHLILRDWHMPTTNDQSTGSIVHAIWRAGKLDPALALRTFDLQGRFSNYAYGEGWVEDGDRRAGVTADLDTTVDGLGRLAKYMLGQAPFPFMVKEDYMRSELSSAQLDELDRYHLRISR